MPKVTRLKDMVISGWEEIIPEAITKPPAGYSNVFDIAQKTGLSTGRVMAILKEARRKGTIEAIQVLINGRKIWYYKDGKT